MSSECMRRSGASALTTVAGPPPADVGSVAVRRHLLHALLQLRKYTEAEAACKEWEQVPRTSAPLRRALERVRQALAATSSEAAATTAADELAKELVCLDSELDMPAEREDSPPRRQQPQQGDQSHACSYCALAFPDRASLRAHCSTAQHHTVIMSDEGRDWKWRPPPRGFTSDTYTLCESWDSNGSCRYGAQCVEAHGTEELAEWKERFEYRRMKMQRACEKELYGKSYTEQLLEKWSQATSPEKIMREKLEGVEETCSADLITTVSSKVSKREWTFVLKTKRLLKAVALLQDAHRNHFSLKQVFPGEPKPNKKGRDTQKVVEADLQSDQEWTSSTVDKAMDIERNPVLEHRIKVGFSTDIYGTFRQSVVFDFGTEPVLVRHLCVDVVPVTDADKIKEIRKEMVLSSTKRWDGDNSDIVPFSSPIYPDLATPYGKETCERDKNLLTSYQAPKASSLCLTQSTVSERTVTKNNYRTRMHELLSVEELARCEQVARYNLSCRLRVAPSYLLAPSGMATSTAKYAHSGELFALLTLGKDVSEDTSAGRLILNNCSTVLLSSSIPPANGVRKRVYEALIEDKGKNMIYLRLSAIAVRELGMRADTDFSADIQFQLNRLTYCEWHYAIDRISDYRLIFPDTTEQNISWSSPQQWEESLDFRLNVKQKEAVRAITSSIGMAIPPILIIGPFGTGKTYTLAQAIKQLLLQTDSKILICTHSNSAADLYIKDYLHPWLEAGITDARPLRIYYHKRWVATVDDTVQQYCLIEMNGGVRSFQLPTLEDVLKHRIVVVTLSISMCLSTLGLPKGYFTHILLDEAAQAMESEALMPLAMATSTTRIVLAGDHMQLSPELFSAFAKERNLHISLLERLYEHYPANFPCKILLCENYRAHEAIIGFTSELFYEQMLIASGKQPRHEKFYPLTFFTTRGEDVQDQNSTAFYNNSEVYEVVERVNELRSNWPASWGKLDEQSIGIMTPYADQVFRIRSELRKRRMGGISVERVLNVQGKQFRAIFLSTVRTRRTCQAASELDYGFLSNRKLLNTAITRAQSMVAVVGDPVALCSIGRCRKVWERFISICNENNSLFGITWSLLRSQLDGVELKKTYTLNPLAPEFIPRAMQPEAYIKLQLNEVTGSPLVQAPSNIPMPIAQMSTGNIRPVNSAQIQPIMNSTNPSMMSYPLFYFPGANNQQQPHGTNIFSIPRAPLPQPPPVAIPNIPQSHQVNTSMNPWNVNAFPSSSPNDPSTPTWSLKQPQKKPVEVNPQAAPMRSFHRVVSSRFAGSPHLLTSQIIPKSQSFLPMPSSQQRLSPENSIINENFIPTDVIVSNYIRTSASNITPERVPYPPNINKYQDTNTLSQIAKEKEQIQFLQNVHFPERALNQGLREIPQVLSMNSNTQELCEGQDIQLRWYQQHLLETQASERASKFIDIQPRLMPPTQVMKPPGPPQFETYVPTNESSRNIENMFPDKIPINPNNQSFNAYNVPNGHGLLTLADGERTWCLSEHKPENVPNQYVNKPFIKDFESALVVSNNIYNQNVNQRDEKAYNARNYGGQETLEVPWQTNNSTSHSVPLYRRQAAPSKPILNQNEPPLPQNLHMEKQNSTTGAFAGYARAFSHLTEPSMLNQHNAIPMPERPMMNGGVGLADYRLHVSAMPPQRMQPQVNSDYTRSLNGTLENMDSDGTTYASVLRQNTPKPEEEKGDPIAVLREYGNSKPQHGLYHYFN